MQSTAWMGVFLFVRQEVKKYHIFTSEVNKIASKCDFEEKMNIASTKAGKGARRKQKCFAGKNKKDF